MIMEKEQTRIRVSFKVSAKGEFMPDVTSEAETVETALNNLDTAYEGLLALGREKGLKA